MSPDPIPTRSSYDRTMNVLARVQLVHLEMRRLNAEAQACTDLERLTAIRAEMDVLHDSMLEIRREQLAEQIERTSPKPGKRWWRRG